jgi:hypothetical protein
MLAETAGERRLVLDTAHAVRKLHELRAKIKDWEARQARTRNSVECKAWKAELEDWPGKDRPAFGAELERKRDEVTGGGTNLYGDAGA